MGHDAFGVLGDEARGLLRPQPHPRSVTPALATRDGGPPSPGREWLYERKLDGIRLLVHRDGDDVRLLTRNGERRASTFPELVDAARALGTDDVVLDGEVVAFDGDRTSFQRLQGRMGIDDPRRALATGIAVHLLVFDVLHLDGHDTTALPQRDRSALLAALLDGAAGPVRAVPHQVGDGVALLAAACADGWEGLVAKRADAPYRSGRSTAWRKLKCERSQALVVAGWTDPRSGRTGFGSLLLGHHVDGRLRYAGRVGTGFSQRALELLHERLVQLEVDEPPFVDPPRGHDLHWAEPILVAQVTFTEWTSGGKLRHPSFTGLRTDTAPRDVVREDT